MNQIFNNKIFLEIKNRRTDFRFFIDSILIFAKYSWTFFPRINDNSIHFQHWKIIFIFPGNI